MHIRLVAAPACACQEYKYTRSPKQVYNCALLLETNDLVALVAQRSRNRCFSGLHGCAGAHALLHQEQAPLQEEAQVACSLRQRWIHWHCQGQHLQASTGQKRGSDEPIVASSYHYHIRYVLCIAAATSAVAAPAKLPAVRHCGDFPHSCMFAAGI